MSTTLTTLDAELLIEILAYVDDTSPTTTRSVSLVNKHLNATSKLVVHRNKILVYVGSGLKSPLSKWRSNDLVLHGIRTLTISEKDPISPENVGPLSPADVIRIYSGGVDPLPERHQQLADNVQKTWDNLAGFVCQLSNLRKLTWNLRCQIPFTVLNALHLHQKKAELAINNWTGASNSADHLDTIEVSLANSPALVKIRALIWPHGSATLAAFKRIVARAPHLRFASVNRGPPTSPPAEDQKSQSFTHKQPTCTLRHLTLDGWGLSEQTLNEWAQYVDLSRLESVKCSRGMPDVSYFNAAPTLLPNLKRMSLNFSTLEDASVKAAAENYIAACAPLTSLSLWYVFLFAELLSPMYLTDIVRLCLVCRAVIDRLMPSRSWANNVSLATILRHGPTLKTLQLHERETVPVDRQSTRYVLTSEDIKAIKSACTSLKSLTFDLCRKTSDLESELETHREIIEALASWQALAKLQIYYDLGIAFIGEFDEFQEDQAGLESDDEDFPSEEGDAEEPSSPPPSKRVNLKEFFYPRPSNNEAIKVYLDKLWRAIYGRRTCGSRALDVKFGEWERKFAASGILSVSESTARTHWVVTPRERDDQADQCVIKMYGTGISSSEEDALYQW